MGRVEPSAYLGGQWQERLDARSFALSAGDVEAPIDGAHAMRHAHDSVRGLARSVEVGNAHAVVENAEAYAVGRALDRELDLGGFRVAHGIGHALLHDAVERDLQ